jgi:hypothetical protein
VVNIYGTYNTPVKRQKVQKNSRATGTICIDKKKKRVLAFVQLYYEPAVEY